MTKHSQEQSEKETHQDDAVEASGFGIGLLIGLLFGSIFGGLAGAGTLLLLAPRLRKQALAKLQRQGLQLRQQTIEGIEDALAEVGDTTHEFTDGHRKDVEKVERRLQAIRNEQKGSFAAIVEPMFNARHTMDNGIL